MEIPESLQINPTKDYYGILGIDKNASPDEIKKAWKRASIKHHPDRGGSEEIFKECSAAYDILQNAEKKAYYDRARTDYERIKHFRLFDQDRPASTAEPFTSTNLSGITLKDLIRGSLFLFQDEYGIEVPDEIIDGDWKTIVKYVYGIWEDIQKYEEPEETEGDIDFGPFTIGE